MTATSTTAPPAEAIAPAPLPTTWGIYDKQSLDWAMADQWRQHWPVGHPERLTDWRRTHLQPWRTVAEHLETVGVDW